MSKPVSSADMKDWANETWIQCLTEAWNEGKRMTDRELFERALSVLCNNVQPRDGVRDNRHLTPKSHVEIHQQTIDALRGRVEQLKPLHPWVGLTTDEINKAVVETSTDVFEGDIYKFATMLETILKEKNSG